MGQVTGTKSNNQTPCVFHGNETTERSVMPLESAANDFLDPYMREVIGKQEALQGKNSLLFVDVRYVALFRLLHDHLRFLHNTHGYQEECLKVCCLCGHLLRHSDISHLTISTQSSPCDAFHCLCADIVGRQTTILKCRRIKSSYSMKW